MKLKLRAGGWLIHYHPLVRILIDVQDALGIRTSKRDRTALSIEYDPQTLSPGHRQLLASRSSEAISAVALRAWTLAVND